ncbi:NADH-quinone oxidoreductase subunit NuoH [Desulforamulus hydrothermalis]|uniref:NADH-quinone oxidoreductase subunit H n=1 Tax=Desulforamulus hydrothermalis Lam5 = DSM 18033 TaxID=1121428 RepID=K8EIN2_9FIRM|nr:NADH-quinone oxidoreductase subunit NuoH [Desulforamulus hydrothermalis]CCO08466.1 NADH-quinone oxidoreductase subunit H [Desulforamulus hydrothermalis Lam5 = DSM 18033]SHH29022.1 NADH dehydrogenase subunit H [Desulforamulus hydrothermalis Lam5 = DSM 18033]
MENLFVHTAGWLRALLAAAGLPDLATDFVMMFLKLGAILVYILISALWLVYMERKVSAYMQCRLGPNRVGPFGLLQTTADIGKLISKEIIIPRLADKKLFLLGPVLIFMPPLAVFAVAPFGKDMVAIDMNIGVYYFLAVASLSTVIVWMSGWASNNKYSLIGGMRVVAQMVSYEMPLILSIVGVIILTGTLNMSEIIRAQENVWFIFLQPLGFIIYLIAGIAETNRAPFDLVEGESEIICGPFTEYSGMGFAMFFLAEYANVVLVSVMATTLFLGGWHAPFGLTFIPSWIWFLLKVYLMIFLFMWFRWTYPRIRVDQLMEFGWKVLVPLSIANIFITGIGKYLYQAVRW